MIKVRKIDGIITKETANIIWDFIVIKSGIFIFKKNNKLPIFSDNKKSTYLVSNNNKLKKIIKFKLENNISNMIF